MGLMSKKSQIVQYIVPFYKEKFVSRDELIRWFRLYNRFNMRTASNKKKFENYVNCNSPDTPSSGLTLVASGLPTAYLKYIKWLNVKHRLIVELGRGTKNGWYFGEQVEQKSYDHLTESRLASAWSSLNNQKIELYDRYFHRENFWEAPRETFVNSIRIQQYRPPYVSLDLSCSGGLLVVNLVGKLGELVDCPISLLDADRYELEGYTRQDCLTSTDIYEKYILESRRKHQENLLNLLKEQTHQEVLFKPTYRRYLLYT